MNEESIEVKLEGLSKRTGAVKQDFYCHAEIHGCNNYALIMSTNIVANFVDPTVELSKNLLSFRTDIDPEIEATNYLRGKQRYLYIL